MPVPKSILIAVDTNFLLDLEAGSHRPALCGVLRFPSHSWAESLPQHVKQPIVARVDGKDLGSMLPDLGHRRQDRSVGRASEGRKGVLLRLSAIDPEVRFLSILRPTAPPKLAKFPIRKEMRCASFR